MCPTRAMTETDASERDALLMVKADVCIGCGVCASNCPEGAIQMRRVRHELPPETGADWVKKLLAG